MRRISETSESPTVDAQAFHEGYSWWLYPNIVKHGNTVNASYCTNRATAMIGSVDLTTKQQAEFALETCGADEHNTAQVLQGAQDASM